MTIDLKDDNRHQLTLFDGSHSVVTAPATESHAQPVKTGADNPTPDQTPQGTPPHATEYGKPSESPGNAQILAQQFVDEHCVRISGKSARTQ